MSDIYFIGWEEEVFGFGYGTGEEPILKALKLFLNLCCSHGGRGYDYRELEDKLGPATTWFLINSLCKVDNLEYGCSPRYGWLTSSGLYLKNYVMSKSIDELYNTLMKVDCSFEYISKAFNPMLNEKLAYEDMKKKDDKDE